MKKYIKIFNLLLLGFNYLIVKQPSSLSDEKLEPLLRIQVHNVEKGFAEERSGFISMIWARKLYYEAKKRDLLSHEESEWCERILFGKKTELISRLNEGFNDEFMGVLKNRRSVRSWRNGELKEKEFEQLIDAARWAPSACNRQPWHFLLTRDKHKIKLLSEIRGEKFIGNAPNCILVLINMQAYDEREAYYTPHLDAGVVIQNLLLKAQVLGLGACCINFGTKEVPGVERRKVKAFFGIPAFYEIVVIIPIGNPKVIPPPPGRKDISDIIHLEKFKGAGHNHASSLCYYMCDNI